MATAIKIFDVSGQRSELELARDAIGRCEYDFGLLPRRIVIRFVPAGQMEKVPGTNSPALAFCHARRRVLDIRSGLRPATTRSVVLHEIGHMVDFDTLKGRRRALMQLMAPAGEKWGRLHYRERPSECFAETFVRAFSDIPSALHGYYQRRIGRGRLEAYREIVLRGATNPADEEEAEEDLGDEEVEILSEEEPAGRQPINIVTNQIGTIARGTPFLHPHTAVRVTSADPGGDFELVGETEDGDFRFAVVETRHLISGRSVRALFLVDAARVHNVRLRDSG